jgi:hypothetical protein
LEDIGEPPEGIGPHEGRELELMLAGKKPLAMFYEGLTLPISDFYPEEDFLQHVKSGALIRREEIYKSPRHEIPCLYVYYALPGEEWRIEEIHRLNYDGLVGGRPWTEEHEQKIGYLLGYSESEISAWLDWIGPKR